MRFSGHVTKIASDTVLCIDYVHSKQIDTCVAVTQDTVWGLTHVYHSPGVQPALARTFQPLFLAGMRRL
jgi:hypothetical protein